MFASQSNFLTSLNVNPYLQRSIHAAGRFFPERQDVNLASQPSPFIYNIFKRKQNESKYPTEPTILVETKMLL